MLLRNALEKEVLKIEVISFLAIFYSFMSSHILIKTDNAFLFYCMSRVNICILALV